MRASVGSSRVSFVFNGDQGDATKVDASVEMENGNNDISSSQVSNDPFKSTSDGQPSSSFEQPDDSLSLLSATGILINVISMGYILNPSGE